MTEFIQDITETTTGYQVKDLKWNERDNIIVGKVKDPITGRDNLHNGYIVCQWRKNGKATNFYKGREDLQLKINY